MDKKSQIHYHPILVSLHWLVALLVFTLLVLGKYMSGLPNDPDKILLLGVHVGLGLITLLAIVVRFIVRLRLPKPQPVSTGNSFLDSIGKLVHYALYLLVFLMAVSGISLSMQSGLTSIFFGVTGASLPEDFFAFSARLLHGFIAPALLALILVHIGAAFYHQFVLKDNLLARMTYDQKNRKNTR